MHAHTHRHARMHTRAHAHSYLHFSCLKWRRDTEDWCGFFLIVLLRQDRWVAGAPHDIARNVSDIFGVLFS